MKNKNIIVTFLFLFCFCEISHAYFSDVADVVNHLTDGRLEDSFGLGPTIVISLAPSDPTYTTLMVTASCRFGHGGILDNTCAGGGYTSGLIEVWRTFTPQMSSINRTVDQTTKSDPTYVGSCPQKTVGGSVVNFHNKSVGEQVPVDGADFYLNYTSAYNDRIAANNSVVVKSPFTIDSTYSDLAKVRIDLDNGVSSTIIYNGYRFYPEGSAEIFGNKYNDIYNQVWDGISGNSSNNIFTSRLKYKVSFYPHQLGNGVFDAVYGTISSLSQKLDQYYQAGVSQLMKITINYFDENGNFIGSVTNNNEVGVVATTDAADYFSNQTYGALTVYHPQIWGLKKWTVSTHHYLDIAGKTLFKGNGEAVNYNQIRSYTDPASGNLVYYVPEKNDPDQYYVFDESGKHLYTRSLMMQNNFIYKFSYDSDFKLLSIENIHHKLTQFIYNQNQLSKIIAPYGQETHFTIENDNISSIENSLAKKYEITYGDYNLMKSFKDLTGLVTEFSYNIKGELIQESKNVGILQTISDYINDSIKTLVVMTGSIQKINQIVQLQQDGEIITEKDGANNVISITRYFEDNTVSSIQMNDEKNYVYSDHGFWGNDAPIFSSVTFSNNSSLSSVFEKFVSVNGFDVNSYTTNPPFYRHTVKYVRHDGHNPTLIDYTPGRLYIYKNAIENTESLLNDKLQVISIARPEQKLIEFGYNNDGQLIQKKIDTAVENFSYDQFGYLSEISNSLGQVTKFVNDSQGKVLVKTLPNQDQIKFEYTDAGEIKKITTPSNQVHNFSFDLGDYINGYLNSDNKNTLYTYDSDKRLQRVKKPSQKEIIYNYEPGFNRLQNIQTPDGAYTFGQYDVNSNPQNATSSDGITTEFVYLGGEVQQQKWFDDDGQELGTLTLAYRSYPITLQQILINGVSITDVSFDAYDRMNGILGMDINYSAAAVSTRYNYIRTLFNNTDTQKLRNAYTGDYDINLGRDYDGFALAREYTQTSTALLDNRYNYYSTQTLQYDSNNRLVSVARTSRSYINGQLIENGDYGNNYYYAPNSNNNISEFTQTGTNPIQQIKRTVASHSADDRLLNLSGSMQRQYSYDEDGNVKSMTNCYGTTSYVYDVFGNLKKVTLPDDKVVEYKIDAMNRRVKKLVNGEVAEYYLWYDQIHLAAILNADKSVRISYLYAPDSQGPSLIKKNGSVYKVLEDPGIASVRYVVDVNSRAIVQQLDYDEFGNLMNNQNPTFQPLMYAGGLYDFDTKLYRFGARDYDPTIGRWTTKDPIGFAGGDTNLYAYVQGNPMSFTDPKGTDITVNYYDGGTGHIGVSVNGGPSYGYYGSYGNTSSAISGMNGNGSMLQDFPRQGKPTMSITFKTTNEQDNLASNYIQNLIKNPGSYNLYNNNCATTAGHVLNAAHVNVPSNFIPSEFFGGLQNGK